MGFAYNYFQVCAVQSWVLQTALQSVLWIMNLVHNRLGCSHILSCFPGGTLKSLSSHASLAMFCEIIVSLKYLICFGSFNPVKKI